MTGDVFRGNLLDGFFNLVGTLTGQGILLVGMMTEAVVTPWLSDRDLALQNVRYVLNAAAGCTRTSYRRRAGSSSTRARQVLAEAIELLERIVDDTLLNAIADGTFGIMKRPADRGKGLDGVAKQERRLLQPGDRDPRRPARDREAGVTARAGEQTIIRPYGDITGDGMVQLSFTLPIPHDKRAEGAALQLADEDGPGPGDGGARQADGRRFTFFVVYGSVNHLVDLSQVVGRRARLPAARGQGDQHAGQAAAAPQARRGRRVHRHRRAHGRHRRDPQRQGHRRREGPGVLPGAARWSTWAPRSACPSWSRRARAEKADAVLVSQVVTQRDAHLHNTREMSAAFREALPGRPAAAARRRRAALRRDDDRRARRRPHLRPGHHPARGRVVPRRRPDRPRTSEEGRLTP